MAAITITAANVSLVSGSPLKDCIAGEAIGVGQVVYLSDAGTWLKAQGDGTAVEAGSNDLGVALGTTSASGQRISVAGSGCIVGYGAVFTSGLIYTIGDTAGSIYPSADNGSGDKVTVLGLAAGTSNLVIQRIYHASAVV